MNDVLRQVLTLVEKGTVEQRCAALLVLGALKLENPKIIKTAGAALNQSNPVLKEYALRYFEEVRPKAGIPLILSCLEDPDKLMQERAVRLLSLGGQAVVQPLLQRVAAGSRVWQVNVARILCSVRGKTALKGLLQMLLSGGDEFNKAVSDLMTPEMRQMDAKERTLLYHEVEAFANKLDATRQRPAVVSAIRLLGQLGRPEARRWLFRFVGPEHQPNIRSYALVALLRCLREQDLRKDEYAKLFSLLEEPEFSEVARLALELLELHDLPEEFRPVLSRMLESRHGPVTNFALRKMGDFGSPATVRTLVEQLGDPDYRRRDIAARSLHKIPEARSALIKELVACNNPSKAWTIAELLPTYEGKWRRDILDALWRRLEAAIGAEGRIQTAFLHVLRSADGDYAYEQLAAQGVRMIKAKKFRDGHEFLALLKDFPEFKAEHKFQLALAQLKLHSPKLASHRHEAAVELLSDLYRSSAYPLLETLKKNKNLAPQDLFYLGFTLAERAGEERSLGRGLLEDLSARFPRTKLGKSAKNKLKLLSR